ncbi:MAG TPA: hypothetical protein VMU95_16625 [Trebonia sp.]|nr:hypothetical protein [Trebonia sp.]
MKFPWGKSGSDSGGEEHAAIEVQRVLAAYHKGQLATRLSLGTVAAALWKEGRNAELLELHRGLGLPPRLMGAKEAAALVWVTSRVVRLPELSASDEDLAERRIDVMVRRGDLAPRTEAWACFALALLRLRERRHADVERLCKPLLTYRGSSPDALELALATVIVARQAQGLSHEDLDRQAAELKLNPDSAMTPLRILARRGDPNDVTADLTKFAADPRQPPQPGRTDRILAAYRDGDPLLKFASGWIGLMLRAEDRIQELLALHAEQSLPPDPRAVAAALSVFRLDDCVLAVPGLPPDTYNLAASRVQWMLDNDAFPGPDLAYDRLGARHTLAVARLRQGRPDEVEPLCADALTASIGDSARAIVLATIVLARHALGQPYADQLAEAVALDPDDYLVRQAVAATV